MSSLIRVLSFLLLFLTAAPLAAEELAADRHWQGTVELKELLQIPVGKTLTIAAGSEVRITRPDVKILVQGRLDISGTAEEPVIFTTPKGWQGIDFMESRTDNRIVQARFEGAEVVVSSYGAHFSVIDSQFRDCRFSIKLLRESDPLIQGNSFAGGEIAIDNEMHSAPEILDNGFSNQTRAAILASHNSKGPITGNRFLNNGQGISLQQSYPDQVRDNLFQDNQVGLYCNQTKNTPEIIGNRFINNQKGLVSFAFAYPVVRENQFRGNKVALFNEQFGSPLVEHNLFEGNDEALHNNRKSNPKVRRNLLRNNRLLMFCDYSSYPLFRENNVEGTREAVRLGIYQSADWEKRSGSKRLVMKQAKIRKSKNTLLAEAPTDFRDRVEVGENWWGELTEQLQNASEDANLDQFWDRHDQPTVVYEGFGPEAYALDRVVFKPVLAQPVVDAGPRQQ